MRTLLATEKEAGHQEEISELKQRPWFRVENGGNPARGGSPIIEKRS